MSITPALKDAFEAFNILYYPIAETDKELAAAVAQADDADMAFAVTSAGNMKGTGYILPPSDVFLLAGVHHSLAGQSGRAVADAQTPNPAADIRDLVPAITVVPMYPGFPQEVLEIDEALFRFHQMIHYASTYGIEYISALVGTPVTVSRGWRPHDGDAPQAGDAATDTSDDYAIFVDAKVVKLVLSTERMRGIVLERLAQPTRMHEAEVRCAAHVLAAPGQDGFVDIAFHENMLGLVQVAAEGTGDELVRMLKRTAQHPGDVLKAITFVRNNRPDEKKHLANRQKRAFCEVLEGFTYNQLATNIAQAKPADRLSLNYLSLARFGGETLKKAVADVESGQVKSWNSKVEQQWKRLALDGPEPLLALYGEKPGMLLRSLTRLVKRGVPLEQIEQAVSSSTEYSLATLVRTLTIMSGEEPVIISIHQHPHENESHFNWRKQHQYIAFQKTARIIRGMLVLKLATLETPLRGKRVFIDEGDFSLAGSVLLPNDAGDTGTAYPPTGMAYRIPDDATVRFFTFWDDQEKRVDVDLHFNAVLEDGTKWHVGWNGDFRGGGMVTSGDVTDSDNAVEYLDLNLAEARAATVQGIWQHCHIYDGAKNWGDICTCFSGATIVEQAANPEGFSGFGSFRSHSELKIYQPENVIFRDDMTGEGRHMDYAYIDCGGCYVRIVRGAKMPVTHTAFTLETYLDMLFTTQDATRVDTREEAEVVLSVGRTEDEEAICLIDEGFFLG